MREAEEPESVAIESDGDTLHLVVLGEDTLKETSHIVALNTTVEAMIFTGDVPPVKLKAHYEELIQGFIEWLVKHRRNQVTAALRKP